MKRSTILLFVVFLLGLSGLAQQGHKEKPQNSPGTGPQQPARPGDDDVVKITTNLVQVDAVITDRKGKLVTDLRPEEVEIFEDGELHGG